MPGSGGRPTDRRRALGRSGEAAAAAWYVEHGYEVLAANWRTAAGELDLVVGRAREVVFCEVKTRSSTRFGEPAEAVTQTKQARLRRLAAAWLGAAGGRRAATVRFDVASVRDGVVTVLERAF